MISIKSLNSEKRLTLVQDLMKNEGEVELSHYIRGAYKNILAQGFGKTSDRDRVFVDVKEPNLSFLKLKENVSNFSAPLFFEWLDTKKFILVLQEQLSKDQELEIRDLFDKTRKDKVEFLYWNTLQVSMRNYPEIEKKYIEIIVNWFDGYSKLALLLNDFYMKHGRLSPIRLYKTLENTEFRELNKNRLFNEKLKLKEKGLDPIQIFASFNYSRIKNEKRVECLNLLFEILEGNCKLSNDVNFDGVPSPIITKIIRYRGWQVQNEVWAFFHEIFEKGIKGFSGTHYLKVKYWDGIGMPTMTMFLFWVNSEQFLPLDQNTVLFS